MRNEVCFLMRSQNYWFHERRGYVAWFCAICRVGRKAKTMRRAKQAVTQHFIGKHGMSKEEMDDGGPGDHGGGL